MQIDEDGGADIVAFGQHAGTVELHRLVGREQTRHFLAEHADVNRAVALICQIEHAFDFGCVADIENGHVRHGAQHTDVIDRLVGNAALEW